MYLQATELSSALYPELQAAISRGQTATVDVIINDAMAFIQAKLSTKYDILAEYQKTGNARNSLLLKFTKDIAIYYLYQLIENVPTKREKSYDDAVAFLNDVVKGRAVLSGIPLAPIEDTSTGGNISFGSEQKRNNRLN